MEVNFIFSIIILIFSVIIHEVSHGYMANVLGDPTPRLHGRLSLNPLKHLEWFGSLILPALCYWMGGFIFGWAKPVLINPYNLKYGKWGEALVAVAGPISNILLATIFSMIIRFSPVGLSEAMIQFFGTIVIINLVLATFNLIPIPPLDGSKILFALLPAPLLKIRYFLEKYSLVMTLILLVFLNEIGRYVIVPVVNNLLGFMLW
jgi:Zn-dependent protease